MIAVFSDISCRWPVPCTTFATWSQLLDSGLTPTGFWISASWSGDSHHLARKVRASSCWWFRLVHTEIPHDSPLIDGNCSLQEAERKARRLDLTASGLHVEPCDLVDSERLLFFMAVRPSYELTPQYDRTAKNLYVYPLEKAIATPRDCGAALADLAQAGLLQASRLLDRIRTCQTCGSAHLSYVEVCPACASIDIHRAPQLNCLSCGLTLSGTVRANGGATACPGCNAELEMVDRYLCNTCDVRVAAAPLVGHCYDCRTNHRPEMLGTTEVHAYTIGMRGVEALRGRELSTARPPFQTNQHVLPAFFRQLLGWSSSAQKRHSAHNFGVLLIEFSNLEQLLAHHQPHKVAIILAEFACRLRREIRDCDVTSSDRRERIWVLLPLSVPDAIGARLQLVANEQSAGADIPLQLRVRTFFSPRDLAAEDDPSAIMKKLLSAVSAS